jgi:hypothetical protein
VLPSPRRMPKGGDDREAKDIGVESGAAPDSDPCLTPLDVGRCLNMFVTPRKTHLPE